jgi:hypothetical protein
VKDCSWILRQKNNFENIRPENFKCCSDRTDHLPTGGYNCIAWAAGKTDQPWWPTDEVKGYFWPPNLPKQPIDEETLDNFVKAFELEGYSVCANGEFESGFEKVAIYTNSNGRPLHAARSLPSGVWTSKMGDFEDIEHETVQVVEGKQYGTAKAFLKRPNPLCQKPNQQKTWFSRPLEFLRTQLKRFSPIAKRNQTSN